MRKITTLLLLLSFTISYAQEAKPTKEETLQYIKSVVEGREFNNTTISEDGPTYLKNEYIYSYLNLELASCKLAFLQDYKFLNTARGFTHGNTYKEPLVEKQELKVIDFSKTESIGFLTAELINFKDDDEIATGQKLLGLTFTQRKDDGTYDNSASIYVRLFDSDFTDYESLKIYKAFQHLRKLCGAPDPISFD